MDQETRALLTRHQDVLAWLAERAPSKPVAACIGFHRVMRDARIVKAAKAIIHDYQPVLLGISESGSYECSTDGGAVGVSCPAIAPVVRTLAVSNSDQLAATLELQAVLLWPVVSYLRPEIIHAHDVMGLRCGALMKRWLHAEGRDVRLVYDSHEYVRGLAPGRRTEVMAQLQDRCIHAVDALITVGDSILRAIRADYAFDKPGRVVFNCPPRADMQPPLEENLKSRLGLSQDTPVGVWTGSVTHGRGPQAFIASLQRIERLHLAFLTPRHTAFFGDLLDLARRAGCGNRIHSVPQVHYSLVPNAIRGADFGGIGFIPNIANHEYAMPNKFFEYLQAEVPLVVTNSLDMGSFVARHGIGEVYEADSPATCASAIERILRNGAEHYASRLRALVGTYSWEYQASRIEEMYAAARATSAARAAHSVEEDLVFPWIGEPRWRSDIASLADISSSPGDAVTLQELPSCSREELATQFIQAPAKVVSLVRDIAGLSERGGRERARDVLDDLLLECDAHLERMRVGGEGASVDWDLPVDTNIYLMEALLRLARTSPDQRLPRLATGFGLRLLRRVEEGGLLAGSTTEAFLLKSRWGSPADFGLQARAIRSVGRLVSHFQSGELSDAVGALARPFCAALKSWLRRGGSHYRTFGLLVPLTCRANAAPCRIGDLSFNLRDSSFAGYALVPNKGLLSARIDAGRGGAPLLRLEAASSSQVAAFDPPRCEVGVALPEGYGVARKQVATMVRDGAGEVQRRAVLRVSSDGPWWSISADLAEPWQSTRRLTPEAERDSLLSAIALAEAVFMVTRLSEAYDLLCELWSAAAQMLEGERRVADKVGWSLAGLSTPLSLARVS